MKQAMKLQFAADLAAKILEALKPGCVRAEIVGSVRRKAEVCGDIEILCIPLMEADGLFGAAMKNALWPILEQLCVAQRLMFIKGAEKMRQYAVVKSPGVVLDLFVAEPVQWGYEMVVRTGPKEFSRSCVTQRREGGLLRDGLVCIDKRVWYRADCEETGKFKERERRIGGKVEQYRVPILAPGKDAKPFVTDEEAQFLELCGGMISPQDRK